MRAARASTGGPDERGEFHVSHDASLHTILSSLRTHVILSVLISSTGTRQFNNGGKRLVLPIKPSVPLLCRSIYDFRSTIPNISLQQARPMQSKIPRPSKYKVASIGDKIQRKEIAPINNKNNKDITIFFVTQHQLSIRKT